MMFPQPSDQVEQIAQHALDVFRDEARKHDIRIKSLKRIRTPLMEFIFCDQKNAFDSLSCGDITICFHGTKTENLDSISDIGFLDPDNPKYKVANGNSYGKGIYMSKDINYASSYAKTSLIVTACLTGAINEHSRNPLNFMLVLNSKSQVLPLFVAEVSRKNIAIEIPKEVNNVSLFDFAETLNKHMKNAEMISNVSGVSLGTCLHLCHKTFTTELLTEAEGLEKILKYLSDYQVE